MITAFNPLGHLYLKWRNFCLNRELEHDLDKRGLEFLPVLVSDHQFDYLEHSFCVCMDLEEAVIIADHYQQFAVFIVDDNELSLCPCQLFIDQGIIEVERVGLFNHLVRSPKGANQGIESMVWY
ncbi:DUF3293 domain-containing protein [Psychrobium sp. 1_MG-2023]|uniref:DUF3293 domain-containing protein n=1 Tax=Psychrobium sp. 1_MG-2023 TaxID=3062624 RepID=UPI002733D9FC|nr:DUF3293 domain-containing protein [Psychrobium sp. 1_MG-2023]MDP2560958.1 DUF3293 domain-containing protein [Psychrobium sp. 1_MG-2023]